MYAMALLLNPVPLCRDSIYKEDSTYREEWSDKALETWPKTGDWVPREKRNDTWLNDTNF